MFLSKSSSGIYYLWYTVDGKRRRTSTRSKQKHVALSFLRAFKITEHQKQQDRSNTPLQVFINDFLAYAAGVYAKSTTTIFKLSLNNLMSFSGNVPINSFTPKEYDAFIIHRLKTITPVSVNIELRSIKSAFNTALRWGLIGSNPFSKQKLLSIPETAPVFFSNADFQKLINKIKEGWIKEIVIFAVLTGLRRGEIVNLCWQDVNLSSRTIKIQSSLKFKTKTRKNRVIPLSDSALYMLQSKANKNLSEYVFTLNDKQIQANWITHKFKYYVYECKFSEDRLHFHSLRHTFASWLVQDGVSIYAIKELLGHSDIKTTQIYSHLQPALMHDTVNKIKIILN